MRERYFIFLMLIYLFFLSYWTIDLAKAEFQVGLSAILLLLLLFWMRKTYIFIPIEFVIHIRVTFFN